MTTHPSYSTIDHTYFDITGTLPSLQQPFFSGHFLVQDARYDGRPNAYFKEHGYLNITLSGTAVFYHDTASVVLNAGKTFLYKWEDPRMHIAGTKDTTNLQGYLRHRTERRDIAGQYGYLP